MGDIWLMDKLRLSIYLHNHLVYVPLKWLLTVVQIIDIVV